MISMKSALNLKRAGLKWIVAQHDFFAIPARGLDQHVFVISDMTVAVEMYGDYPVVTFNGASEWALDYVTLREVVWLPREDQLRLALENRWFTSPGAEFELSSSPSGYRLCLSRGDEKYMFTAEAAGEVYAQALLLVLESNQDKRIRWG
jgi:hypothetical protein